ncbi:AfsR/SARP family transcriptional regulator [Kineococcus rhizosphaerae]|uniref:AfsR/SARP family transcriptional regulator n=1 Tax=Kineococcus rhizosphaerae TaxID=559628 RepID=UPI0014761934|nr:AfsR/SARP family transcriptional regulator [Kineococcus rhizosphaerae]
MLGPVRAEVDGRGVDLGGPVRRSVLTRLVAAHGQVVSTDRLLEDLWPAVPSPTALAALQVHVSHLRRALEPDRPPRARAEVLVSAAPGYALRLPRANVDAWRFEDAVAAGTDLEHALADGAGPPYAEVSDTAWAAPEAARLTELRLGAVETLAAERLGAGDPAAVVALLDRHAAEHPTREEAVRLLALGLYRCGRQADALAVLRRTRRHLADEFGVDPGPVLRSVEQAVLQQDPGLWPAVPPVPRTARTVEADPRALVGRDPELAVLTAAARDAAAAGEVRVVWVDGEAGAGKTTLLDAFTRTLTGWTTTWGRCPEVDGAPPGWAWREVLDDLGHTDPLPQNTFHLARTVADHLAAVAPVLVVLDDAHRADDVTRQLLRQVVDQLDETAAVVVCAYRGTEAGAGLGLVRAALAPAAAAHLDLAGLGREAVAALARSAGGRALDPTTVDWLTDRTGGNPLFVRELARLLAGPGPLAPATGPPTTVPAGIADVLRARLARLPAATVDLLRTAALLGRELDVDVLARVLDGVPGEAGGDGDGGDAVEDGLDTAVVAGLLEETTPGRVRFTHALVRDVLADDLLPARRRRTHGRVLAVLEDLAPHDVDALAHHALAGLTPATAARAREHAERAATRAARTSPQRAAELLTGALSAHDLTRAPDPAVETRLRCALVAALAAAGDAVAARAAQTTALARAGDDEQLLHAVLTCWDAPLVWTVRRETAGDPLRLRLLDRLPAPTGPADVVRREHARFLELETWDVPAAIACSARALAAARQAGDPRLLCLALNLRGYAALGPDLDAERGALADELVDLAGRHGLDDFLAVGLWLRFLARASRGDRAGATAAVAEATAVAGSGQLGHLLLVLSLWHAVVDLTDGRLEEGARRYAGATAALAAAGDATAPYMAAVGRFATAWHRGRPREALAEVRAADASGRGATAAPLVLCLLDAGRQEEARRRWAAREPVRRDMLWLALTALHAHAAARLGDAEAARELHADLLPFAGRYAGLDCGTLPVGPVDDTLAVLRPLL